MAKIIILQWLWRVNTYKIFCIILKMGDRMPGYAYLNEIEDFLSFYKQLEAQQA